MENAPLIYSRIAACIAEVEAVGKDHRNQSQGYSFRAIDDFYDALQPVLAKNKVFITPTILEHKREERTTKNGGVMMTTLAHVRFRVWTEDGSFIEADALGEGSDSGDKSANKSAAQALKYLFMQVFCVRVKGESIDPEQHSPAYEPKRAPTPTPRPAPKPAPQANVERRDTAIGAHMEPATRLAAAPADVLPAKATEKTREWALAQLEAQVGLVAVGDFFASKGWIRVGDRIDGEWPLEHVPTSKAGLQALIEEIQKTAPQVPANQQNDGNNLFQSGDSGLPPEWADVIFTIPPKGMKRQAWLDTKTTIGMMYQGDSDQKRRLFSFAKNWCPEPWIDPATNKKYPVKPEDAECRVGLDLFLAWRNERGDTNES
jgi:hypothetical protein